MTKQKCLRAPRLAWLGTGSQSPGLHSPAPNKDLSPTPGPGVATARGLDPDPASSRPWTKKHRSQRPGQAASLLFCFLLMTSFQRRAIS